MLLSVSFIDDTLMIEESGSILAVIKYRQMIGCSIKGAGDHRRQEATESARSNQ